MNPIGNNEDYDLSLYEACEKLSKSSRTITRYVHRHILHPRGIKSRQGTLEYRFSRAEIESLRQRQNELGQFNDYDDSAAVPAQAAAFASLAYPPAVRPKAVPFPIPGVSFPTADEPSSAAAGRPSYRPEQIPSERENEIKQILPEETHCAENVDARSLPKELEIGNNSKKDEEIIALLRETTGMLRDQLKVKDDQIKNLDDKIGQLIERNRETNILLKGLQDKMVLLEKPKTKNPDRADRIVRGQSDQVAQKTDAGSDSPSPVPLPKDSRAYEPVRINISSTEENNFQDKPANTAPEPLKAEDCEIEPVAGRRIETEKKGLFGKIFG